MTHMQLGRAETTYFIFQVVVILLFGLFTGFFEGAHPLADSGKDAIAKESLKDHYPCF